MQVCSPDSLSGRTEESTFIRTEKRLCLIWRNTIACIVVPSPCLVLGEAWQSDFPREPHADHVIRLQSLSRIIPAARQRFYTRLEFKSKNTTISCQKFHLVISKSVKCLRSAVRITIITTMLCQIRYNTSCPCYLYKVELFVFPWYKSPESNVWNCYSTYSKTRGHWTRVF